MSFDKMHLLVLFCFVVISLFSLRIIFASSDPVAFHDLAPMYRLDQLSRPYDFPWDYKSNLGSPSMLNGNTIYNLPLIGLSIVFGSVAFAHKIALVLLMALSGFGFYLAFLYLLRSKTTAFVAGLFMIFNPFTLQRWTYGHNTIILACMILPLAVLVFFKVTKEGGRKLLVVCGLLTSLLIATDPHTAYLFMLFVLLYAITELMLSNRTDILKKIKFRGKQIGLIFAVALIGAFPIFYQLTMIDLTVYSVRAEEAGASFRDITASALPQIALIATITVAILYVWKKHNQAEKSVFSLIIKDRQQILFFAILGLFGVLLFFLATEPFAPLYTWLFNNVPGFAMFREVNKFFLLSTFSVAFFLGFVAESLRLYLSRKGSSIIRKVLPILLVSIIAVAPSWQFITGNMDGNLGTTSIPQDYQQFENWLLSQNSDFRIALLPPAAWATTYTWAPRWFLDPLVALQTKPTVELKSEFDLTPSASLSRWIYSTLYSNRTSEWGKLLSILGVEYVVLRTDADLPSDRADFRIFSLNNTIASWSNQKDLQLEKQFGNILVYKNNFRLPHLYETEGLSLVIGDRRSLISLNSLDFDFNQNPAAFIDDNIDLTEPLIKNAEYIISQGDPYWSLLASSLGTEYIVKPWLHAPVSVNPSDKWVDGKLTWYHFNGDLNVAPDGYVYTNGANTINIPLNIKESGSYHIIVQVYNGLPNSKGIEFSIDNVVNYTFTPTRSFEGSYMWIDIGHGDLNSQSILRASSLAGPAAISKIAIIPENEIDEIEQNISKQLQESNAATVYTFDDYAWNYSPAALIVNSEASNGRFINLSKSTITTNFYTFEDNVYTLRSLWNSTENATVRFHIDNYVKDINLNQTTVGFPTVDIESLNLTAGNHSITIELIKGNAQFDIAVLSDDMAAFNEPLSSLDLRTLNYTMHSGSEYTINSSEHNLVFLEGGSGYWRLYGQKEPYTSVTVFNYGTAFLLNTPKSQYTLRYLGLEYLQQGFLITFTALASLLVGLKLLGSKRFALEKS